MDYVDYGLKVENDLTIKAPFKDLKAEDKMDITDSLKVELDKALLSLERREHVGSPNKESIERIEKILSQFDMIDYATSISSYVKTKPGSLDANAIGIASTIGACSPMYMLILKKRHSVSRVP